MARKTKLTKKLWQRIVELIREDTYTINEICRMCDISTRVFFNWRNRNEEFDADITAAEDARMEDFVKMAKNSLRKKIEGYTVDETSVVTVPSSQRDANGKPIPIVKEQKVVKKHIQPDTAAIIFTLTNGDPKRWQNKFVNEVTGKGGKDILTGLTDTELDREIENLQKKLQ